jgi:hypothetical protein
MNYQKKSSKDIFGVVFYIGRNIFHLNDKWLYLRGIFIDFVYFAVATSFFLYQNKLP